MADEVEAHFEDKPRSGAVFGALAHVIDGCDDGTLTVGSQIGWGRERKFAWFWLYNVTRIVVRTLDGARSAWLAELISQAYAYGGGTRASV